MPRVHTFMIHWPKVSEAFVSTVNAGILSRRSDLAKVYRHLIGILRCATSANQQTIREFFRTTHNINDSFQTGDSPTFTFVVRFWSLILTETRVAILAGKPDALTTTRTWDLVRHKYKDMRTCLD